MERSVGETVKDPRRSPTNATHLESIVTNAYHDLPKDYLRRRLTFTKKKSTMRRSCHVAGLASPSTSVLKAASKGADPTFSGTRSPSIASMVTPWMSPHQAAA